MLFLLDMAMFGFHGSSGGVNLGWVVPPSLLVHFVGEYRCYLWDVFVMLISCNIYPILAISTAYLYFAGNEPPQTATSTIDTSIFPIQVLEPTWLLGRHEFFMVVPRQLLLSRSGCRALNHLKQCASINRHLSGVMDAAAIIRLMNNFI